MENTARLIFFFPSLHGCCRSGKALVPEAGRWQSCAVLERNARPFEMQVGACVLGERDGGWQ